MIKFAATELPAIHAMGPRLSSGLSGGVFMFVSFGVWCGEGVKFMVPSWMRWVLIGGWCYPVCFFVGRVWQVGPQV